MAADKPAPAKPFIDENKHLVVELFEILARKYLEQGIKFLIFYINMPIHAMKHKPLSDIVDPHETVIRLLYDYIISNNLRRLFP